MAIEAATGRLVVVAVTDAGRLSTLSPGRGVRHRHLASIVETLRDVAAGSFPDTVRLPPGAGAAVAEHVPGRTLRAVLESGPLHAAKAVAWTLRLADAVASLHAAGAVHGAISPRSVIAEPSGRAIAPVLSQLIVPPIGPYCPPERLRGAAESASDDVWALYATLYAALSGHAPFSGATREELLKSMSAGPAALPESERALSMIIARGLSHDRRARVSDLSELLRALDAWERDPTNLPAPPPGPPRPAVRGLGDIVGGTAFGPSRDDGIAVDDSELPDDQGAPSEAHAAPEPPAVPAPLPPPARSLEPALPAVPDLTPARVAAAVPVPQAPPKRPSFNPFERKHAVLPWVLAAALGSGGAVYLFLAPSRTATVAAPSASAAEPPVAPAPVQAKPRATKSPEERRDECIREHFPDERFDGEPDLSFVCESGNFPEAAKQLYAMPRPALDDAGDSLGAMDGAALGSLAPDAGAPSKLGWYELPASAIIRKTCCPGAAPVILPETPGWCEQLQSVVRRMAEDSAKSVDLSPGARTFDKAVSCLFAGRVRHGYAYDKPPSDESRKVFQQFLSRAAIIGARR